MTTLGITRERAAFEALNKQRQWHDAALVMFDDGSFDAVPSAYLTDISYGLRANVVSSSVLPPLWEITGDERLWSDLAPDEQQWCAKQVAQDL